MPLLPSSSINLLGTVVDDLNKGFKCDACQRGDPDEVTMWSICHFPVAMMYVSLYSPRMNENENMFAAEKEMTPGRPIDCRANLSGLA